MNDIYMLHEGTCPTCEEPAAIVEVGGTAEEVAAYDNLIEPTGAPTFTVWEPNPNRYDLAVLGLTFRCKNGHEHYIQKNAHGDWA